MGKDIIARGMKQYLEARPGSGLDVAIDRYVKSLDSGLGIGWVGAYEVHQGRSFFLALCHLVNQRFTQAYEDEVAINLVMMHSLVPEVPLRMKVYNGVTPYGVRSYFKEEVKKLEDFTRMNTLFERNLDETS